MGPIVGGVRPHTSVVYWHGKEIDGLNARLRLCDPMRSIPGNCLRHTLTFLWAVFCIFQIPVAVAENLETVLVCRFLQAAFGAAPAGILGGCYVDFLKQIELGIAISIFAATVFAGPAVGPIAGSFITESSLGWRWTAWITLIVSVVLTGLAWLVTPETFAPLLLRWKAKRLRYSTKDWALHAQSEEQEIDFRTLATKYLTRPLRMIALEPIVSYLEISVTARWLTSQSS